MSRPGRWVRRRRAVGVGFALLLLGVAITWITETRRLDRLYWHDVRSDHRYRFSEAFASTVAVDRNGFRAPALPRAAHTAMLSLEVSSTWLGRWREPAIEVVTPSGATRVQFMERGARGRRFVNLGEVLDVPLETETVIGLRGRHLTWERQKADLLWFPAPDLEAGPLLVVAPHPDDAEIAAFGLYSRTEAWVVTVSAGNYGDQRLRHLLDDPASRNRLVGEARAWDSVAIPLWGGVPADRALNLGYFNGALLRMYRQPRTPIADEVLRSADIARFRRVEGVAPLAELEAASTWESLVNDLISLLDQVRPSTVVTPHPLLDASMDHRLSTVAVAEAIARGAPAPRQLLLYTNHHVTSEYFPFGPARGLVSLPPWTEAPIEARGVYSHRLDEQTRVRKLYALEAQHDLRPAPRFVQPGVAQRLLGELGRTIAALWRDPADSYSYLRRGPRPNELFLVASGEDLPALRLQFESWLASAHPAERASAPKGEY